MYDYYIVPPSTPHPFLSTHAWDESLHYILRIGIDRYINVVQKYLSLNYRDCTCSPLRRRLARFSQWMGTGTRVLHKAGGHARMKLGVAEAGDDAEECVCAAHACCQYGSY